MENRKLISGEKGFILLFVVFSVLSGIGSVQILMKKLGLSSPGAFPVFTSSIMLITSLIAWRELKTLSSNNNSNKETIKVKLAYILPKNVVVIIGFLMLYALLLEVVGFNISTFLFLFISMSFLITGTWKKNIFISVGTLVIILLIFSTIFRVILP